MYHSARIIAAAGLAVLLCSCKPSQVDISESLKKADLYVSEGNLQKARIELQNVLRQVPNDPQANLSLARLEDGSGDINEAVQHYLRAAAPEARLIDAQLRLADIMLDSNRLLDASGRINTTLGAFPDSAAAMALRADIAQRQSQTVQAKSDADSALQRDPDNARALAVLALLKLQTKDNQGALALAERGLQKHPDDLRLLQVQAAIALTASDPDKAVQAFRSIVRAAPGNLLARSALAQIEAANGHYDEALASLQDGVKTDPTNPAMQMTLINFLNSQKKSSEVVAYLNTLISQYPNESTYVLILAEFYRAADDLTQSRAVLDKASARLGTSPAGLQVKIASAKLDSNAERYDLAESKLREVLAVDPQNQDALLVRALMALKNKRNDAAITDLLSVVRYDPANEQAFDTLATAYTAIGDRRLAVDAMRRAVAVRPGDDRAEIRLAIFLQQSGDGNAARELMARVTLRRPQVPIVWFTDGELAIERKDWDGALRAISRLQDLPNAEMQSTQLKAELKTAQGNPGAAIADFEKVIDQDPNVAASTIAEFARVAIAAQKSNEAAQYLTGKIPSLNSKVQQAAWTGLIQLQAQVGNFVQADAAFKAAVKIAPADVSIYATYVNALIAAKRVNQARQAVSTGLDANAPKWAMLMLGGMIDESVGDDRAALVNYQAASVENPLSLDAANNYASILADKDPKNTEALTAARKRLDNLESSSNSSLVDTIAWLDYRLGRIDEAKVLLTRINAQQSQNPQIRFHLAAVLLASGDRPGGLALLDTVKGLSFPGSDEIQSLSAT